MNVIFRSLAAICLFTIASCKKTDSNPGGTWTFESVNYGCSTAAVGNTGSPGVLTAWGTTSGVSGQATVIFRFYNSLPTVSGNYAVVKYIDTLHYIGSAGQVNVSASTPSGANYFSTGGNGNGIVSVVVSGGKVSASGSGIELANSANPADSGELNFNILQTQ